MQPDAIRLTFFAIVTELDAPVSAAKNNLSSIIMAYATALTETFHRRLLNLQSHRCKC